MKTIFKSFIVVLILLFSIEGYSQQKNMKIGHTDLQKLIIAMPQYDSSKTVLEKETKSIQDQLELMQVEYNNKLYEYINKKDSLSKFMRQSKEEELQSLEERIRNFSTSAQQSLEEYEGQLLQPIIERVKSAVSAVAKENNYTYIFDLSANIILYNSPESDDITPLVKKKLGLP